MADVAATAVHVLREVALALRHWPYFLPLLAVLLGMSGRLGRGFGVPNLFRDDDQIFDPTRSWNPLPAPPGFKPPRILASPAFWSGFGFMAAFGLFWMVVHAGAAACGTDRMPVPCPTALYTDPTRPRDAAFGYMLWALAAAAASLGAANLRQLMRPRADFLRLRPGRIAAELARLAAGAALGLMFTLAGYLLPFAAAPMVPAGLAARSFLLPSLLFVVAVLLLRSALPCTSIFSLILAVLLLGGAFPAVLTPWAGWVAVGVLVWLAWANGRAGKYSIEGFPPALPDASKNPQNERQPQPRRAGVDLIRPTDALQAWHGGGRPVLVLLATSGGAYRAAFWTSLLLDRLIAESRPGGRWPGLAGNIRLVTGASGGMVAGAYFVAMSEGAALGQGITPRIAADTWTALRDRERRFRPIARDSLSPVIHQMVRRDLPRTLLPFRQDLDRGRVLDQQWRTLRGTFASIHGAEARGAVPSMIVAPMLVETGALALFSNLDLRDIRVENVPEPRRPGDEDKVSVEIFRAFPEAHARVPIATAVRLNATFPYISPAISLPTWPERRPVDAGYFDNYGVNLLTAYLRDDAISAWIRANCARVAIIQVRAFPSEVPTAPASVWERAIQFATSPPEGLFSARKASQMFRNDQVLVRLIRHYATAQDPDFLKVFTFEANTDVSLSWYQRCDEMRALEGLLAPPRRNEMTFDGPVLLPAADAGDEVSRDEIRDWAVRRFGDWNGVIEALQDDDPAALRSQYLHHRAKVAEEFRALERFWAGNTGE